MENQNLDLLVAGLQAFARAILPDGDIKRMGNPPDECYTDHSLKVGDVFYLSYHELFENGGSSYQAIATGIDSKNRVQYIIPESIGPNQDLRIHSHWLCNTPFATAHEADLWTIKEEEEYITEQQSLINKTRERMARSEA